MVCGLGGGWLGFLGVYEMDWTLLLEISVFVTIGVYMKSCDLLLKIKSIGFKVFMSKL